MSEPKPPPHPVSSDDFERFDEAQPFLQFLADLLNRLMRERNAEPANTPDDQETHTTE